jgi:mxaJ protein
MSSACKPTLMMFVLLGVVLFAPPEHAATPELRVCADPNNLPYSNDKLQGFENRVAELVAKDLGMQVSYFWYPQREKFFAKH